MWSCGLQVRVVEGDAKGRTYPLDSPEVTIGRNQPGAIRTVGLLFVDDQSVSRLHAELNWNEDTQAYTLFNRSETNPTRVNGLIVDGSVQLKPGDQIRMGKCVLDLQQADFRFGGRPPSGPPRAPGATPRAPAPAPKLASNLRHSNSHLDDEKSVSTRKAGRIVSLTTRPQFLLEILEGPDAGQSFPVTGLSLALGGLLEIEPEDPSEQKTLKWFDQEIQFNDSELPLHCLSLKWKELENAFELTRLDEVQLEVTVGRHVDGMELSGYLSYEAPALIRAHDMLRIGNSLVHLAVPSDD